jgi:hypothetical protein
MLLSIATMVKRTQNNINLHVILPILFPFLATGRYTTITDNAVNNNIR